MKGRKNGTVVSGGSLESSVVGEVLSSRGSGGGKKEQEQEEEVVEAPAIIFSKIRNERDRVRYAKAMAEKKIKVSNLLV